MKEVLLEGEDLKKHRGSVRIGKGGGFSDVATPVRDVSGGERGIRALPPHS